MFYDCAQMHFIHDLRKKVFAFRLISTLGLMDAKDELCKVDGGGGKAQSGKFILFIKI